MRNYISYFLSPTFLALGALVLIFSYMFAWRSRITPRSVAKRWILAMCAASVGAILVVTSVRDLPQGVCLQCLLNWSFTSILSGGFGPGELLNVLLFVPAALFGTLYFRTPIRVWLALVLLSVMVEFGQALFATGANDLVDIMANAVGASCGAFFGSAALVMWDWFDSGRVDWRRPATLAASGACAVALIGGVSLGGAHMIQAEAAAQLEALFEGTTLADYFRADAFGPQLQDFWVQHGYPSSDALSDLDRASHRFTWRFLGSTRCVTAIWTVDGFATRLGADNACEGPVG